MRPFQQSLVMVIVNDIILLNLTCIASYNHLCLNCFRALRLNRARIEGARIQAPQSRQRYPTRRCGLPARRASPEHGIVCRQTPLTLSLYNASTLRYTYVDR